MEPYYYPPNLKHNPNTNQPPMAKKITISVLVISLPFIYVSFLHQPPSALFHDTTFWFLLSNSIIIVIAADSGLFSASREAAADDIYDEFARHSRPRATALLPSHPAQATIVEKREGLKEGSNSTECLKVSLRESPKERKGGQSRLELAVVDGKESSKGASEESSKESPKEKKCVRSRSRIAVNAGNAKADGLVLRRTATEVPMGRGEESEYWKLSDEELNKRVEDFIRRFNREIRLQEVSEG